MHSMGFGIAADTPAPLDLRMAPDTLPLSPWAGSMHEIGRSLGTPIEAFTYTREVAVSDRLVPTAIGVIEPGLVVAIKLTVTGRAHGRDFIIFEFYWRLDQSVRPDWPTGHKWHLSIHGDPQVESTLVSDTFLDAGRTASLHAAAGVVNAIPTVCDAAPGVRTVLDLPMWAGAYVNPSELA
jgi:4-hydroxy-tetrahydrodipicolinate reductase